MKRIFCMLFMLCFLGGCKDSDTATVTSSRGSYRVVCIDGYEFVQSHFTGYVGGFTTVQFFVNTDEGLRAKVCRDAGEQQ